MSLGKFPGKDDLRYVGLSGCEFMAVSQNLHSRMNASAIICIKSDTFETSLKIVQAVYVNISKSSVNFSFFKIS